MGNLVKLKTASGQDVEFIDDIIGSGGMKDVYFSPDKSYVVAFFRAKQDFRAKDRLENIVGVYRQRILEQPGGDYWKDLYTWPSDIVEHNGLLGVVVPTYHSHFFFKHGSRNDDFINIRGQEKQGKWFASAKHRANILDPKELGNWRSYLSVCIKIARAVRRMHMAGLAHSDLSYKNVLIDPSGGNACIIDIDGLVVPGKFPPEVAGTPDFFAPEVMASLSLKVGDPAKCLPCIETDRHALAVLVYIYLLYRHPLRGRKVFHVSDDQLDESLRMGSQAIFIEHPSDDSNRPNLGDLHPAELPWGDVSKIPHSVTGPYLQPLFHRAFVEGLHDPSKRPTADDWERALVQTVDLLQPCTNPTCHQQWYVFDNTTKPACPFCGTQYNGILPVLNLYSRRGKADFRYDNQRLMVYHNQHLFPWHVNRLVNPSEKLTPEQKKPVGYFALHHGAWVLVNQNLPDLKDVDSGESFPVGRMVELSEGRQLLLSAEENGRLIRVQLVGK